jgi:Dolichyl-phosphate-mannose-protein mannosyltransferase
LTNSGDSRHSDRSTAAELACVVFSLALLITVCACWLYSRNYILYYGDAQAHLNISRSVIDSRTPGYDQLGTVWLPLLHAICLPFVGNDWLWSTGLAGTIPVAVCFVLAGTLFYQAARTAFGSRAAAAVCISCLALNPNVLYLSAIPMTETLFLAGLAALLFAGCRFAENRNPKWLVLTVVACWLTCLTRYDGWFLIPFAAAWIAYFSTERVKTFILLSLLASAAAFYWFAHNWWETSNALDFYNGPYSPRAIQGGKPYPGYQNLAAAVHYYLTAGRLCAGSVLLLVGLIGTAFAVRTKACVPVLFLLLTPLFYIVSMDSSGGSPIYVPVLWPNSYYNTRYGIAVVPFAAFAAGALVTRIPPRWRRAAFALPCLTLLPWLLHPGMDNVICWKESEVNSRARRAWSADAAIYLETNYRTGQGITAAFGDLTSIFCRARIPLREVLHEGNGPEWFATKKRPELLHSNLWLISMAEHEGMAKEYRPVVSFSQGGRATVQIYRRAH